MAFALLEFANAMQDSLAVDANPPIPCHRVSTIVLDMEFAKAEIASVCRRSRAPIARMSVLAFRIAMATDCVAAALAPVPQAGAARRAVFPSNVLPLLAPTIVLVTVSALAPRVSVPRTLVARIAR